MKTDYRTVGGSLVRQHQIAQFRAHAVVRRALKHGKLHKPDHCSNCGQTRRLEAHHHDYAEPLQVTWLCRGCHARAHHPVEKHDS